LELASLKVLLAGIVCQTEGPAARDADRFDKVIEAARAASPSHRRCLSAQTRFIFLFLSVILLSEIAQAAFWPSWKFLADGRTPKRLGQQGC
jgi:hypothetical protein